MSNKINAVTIVFEEDFDESYIDKLEQALFLYDGVVSVDRNVADLNSHVARSQAVNELRQELREKLWKFN